MKLQEIFNSFVYKQPKDPQQILFDFYFLVGYVYGVDFTMKRDLDSPIGSSIINISGGEALNFIMNEAVKDCVDLLTKHMIRALKFCCASEFQLITDYCNLLTNLVHLPKDKAREELHQKISEPTYKFLMKYLTVFPLFYKSSGDKASELYTKFNPRMDIRRKNYEFPIVKNSGKYDEQFKAVVKTQQLLKYTDEELSNVFIEIFGDEQGWHGAYGGKNWQNIAECLNKLINSKKTDDQIVWCDHAYDLEHNTNVVFDKIKEYSKNGSYRWIHDSLDWKRDNKTLKEFYEKVSPQLKPIVAYVNKHATGESMLPPTKQEVQAVKDIITGKTKVDSGKTYEIPTSLSDFKPGMKAKYKHPSGSSFYDGTVLSVGVNSDKSYSMTVEFQYDIDGKTASLTVYTDELSLWKLQGISPIQKEHLNVITDIHDIKVGHYYKWIGEPKIPNHSWATDMKFIFDGKPHKVISLSINSQEDYSKYNSSGSPEYINIKFEGETSWMWFDIDNNNLAEVISPSEATDNIISSVDELKVGHYYKWTSGKIDMPSWTSNMMKIQDGKPFKITKILPTSFPTSFPNTVYFSSDISGDSVYAWENLLSLGNIVEVKAEEAEEVKAPFSPTEKKIVTDIFSLKTTDKVKYTKEYLKSAGIDADSHWNNAIGSVSSKGEDSVKILWQLNNGSDSTSEVFTQDGIDYGDIPVLEIVQDESTTVVPSTKGTKGTKGQIITDIHDIDPNKEYVWVGDSSFYTTGHYWNSTMISILNGEPFKMYDYSIIKKPDFKAENDGKEEVACFSLAQETQPYNWYGLIGNIAEVVYEPKPTPVEDNKEDVYLELGTLVKITEIGSEYSGYYATIEDPYFTDNAITIKVLKDNGTLTSPMDFNKKSVEVVTSIKGFSIGDTVKFTSEYISKNKGWMNPGEEDKTATIKKFLLFPVGASHEIKASVQWNSEKGTLSGISGESFNSIEIVSEPKSNFLTKDTLEIGTKIAYYNPSSHFDGKTGTIDSVDDYSSDNQFEFKIKWDEEYMQNTNGGFTWTLSKGIGAESNCLKVLTPDQDETEDIGKSEPETTTSTIEPITGLPYLTMDNYATGTVVCRNPQDWEFGSQDGGNGNIGIVIKDAYTPNWVHVYWIGNMVTQGYPVSSLLLYKKESFKLPTIHDKVVGTLLYHSKSGDSYRISEINGDTKDVVELVSINMGMDKVDKMENWADICLNYTVYLY